MSRPGDPWTPVELLAEPTRRRVFEAVRSADAPITREAVAAAVAITPRLAAFHLDRLAESGLLVVDYARPPGRGGPGAGRPAKRYAAAAVQVDVTVPPRRYNLVARILATAIARSPHDAAAAARAAAYSEGRTFVDTLPPAGPRRRPAPGVAVHDALDRLGYDPLPAEDQAPRLRLRNCPFHDAVDVAPELVCSLNQSLISGVIDGLGAADRCRAEPDGAPPDCCVSVHTAAGSDG